MDKGICFNSIKYDLNLKDGKKEKYGRGFNSIKYDLNLGYEVKAVDYSMFQFYQVRFKLKYGTRRERSN